MMPEQFTLIKKARDSVDVAVMLFEKDYFDIAVNWPIGLSNNHHTQE